MNRSKKIEKKRMPFGAIILLCHSFPCALCWRRSDCKFGTLVSNKTYAFVSIVLTYATVLGAAVYFAERDLFFAATNESKPNRFLARKSNQNCSRSTKPISFRRVVETRRYVSPDASRVNEMIPYTACAFYLADEKKKNLKIKYVAGESLKNSSELK
jgi:hypothetical protein